MNLEVGFLARSRGSNFGRADACEGVLAEFPVVAPELSPRGIFIVQANRYS